ncbi:hypothetical protein C5167_032338 [Papaver somniferum]|uniref:Uncharacterized protein n=1 Tax=Papaver somniferum TaxID=3469 RepID=A0A4Y7KA86_PAPSO|nr:hypothetical protein C5167_032338 [Papaver somniferum]
MLSRWRVSDWWLVAVFDHPLGRNGGGDRNKTQDHTSHVLARFGHISFLRGLMRNDTNLSTSLVFVASCRGPNG